MKKLNKNNFITKDKSQFDDRSQSHKPIHPTKWVNKLPIFEGFLCARNLDSKMLVRAINCSERKPFQMEDVHGSSDPLVRMEATSRLHYHPERIPDTNDGHINNQGT